MNLYAGDPVAALLCCVVAALGVVVATLMEEGIGEFRLVGLNALFVYCAVRFRATEEER